MMAIAFLGYVLPYGQMSHWGLVEGFCSVSGLLITADNKFMAMFMGFIDRDGYFDIGEQK
jgi:quinol-cytochrome oxidoreductase complex cytochrome b subunit